jgi:hypothetical protein
MKEKYEDIKRGIKSERKLSDEQIKDRKDSKSSKGNVNNHDSNNSNNDHLNSSELMQLCNKIEAEILEDKLFEDSFPR